MHRDIAAALVGLSIILLAPSSLAQSTVELGGSISVAEGDMGIEGISVSENQDLVLAHGANSGISLSILILPKTIHISNGVATIRF